MIAIFLSDTFYLVDNINMQDVISIANSEGLSSPKIRAKAVMQLNTEFYNSAMIKNHLPRISFGFYENGETYTIKSVRSTDDLEYFVGPDGRRYTCADAYHSSPYRFVSNNQAIEESTTLGVELPAEETVPTNTEEVAASDMDNAASTTPEESEEQDKTFIETFTGENTAEVSASGGEETRFIESQSASSVALVPFQQVVQKVDADRTEQLESAKFLDNFLSKYPHISMYVKETNLSDVISYLSECQGDLYREVKKPFLEEAGVLYNINSDLGSDEIETALGTSNDMLDSLLTFPVFASLVGKKKRGKRFSVLDADGAQLIRICPVGVNENGELYGFVHMDEVSLAIAQKIENEVKQDLKNKGESYSKLSADEKYSLFEEKLAKYYMKNSGKMLRASGSQKYVDIVEFLTNLQAKKYKISTPYDEERGEFLWNSYENIIFDNRGSKKLEEQISALNNDMEETSSLKDNKGVTQQPEVVSQTPSVQTPNVILLPESSVLKSQTEGMHDDMEALLAALARSSGVAPVGEIPVYDGTGAVIDKVDLAQASSSNTDHSPTILDRVIPGTLTMGGVNPLKPAQESGVFVDEEGRTWTSEEDRKRVLEAIYGSSEDQSEKTNVKKK